MNLVSISNFPKIEIRFTYKNKSIILWLEKFSNFKENIPTIKKMFEIQELISLDLFAGKVYIRDFYTTIPLLKLIEVFLTNKFIIVDSVENPLNPLNLDINREKVLKDFNEEDALDEIFKLKNEIKNLLVIDERREENLNQAGEDLFQLLVKSKKLKIEDDFKNFNNEEEEDFEIMELKEMLFNEEGKCESLENLMEKKFEKIISFKSLEKEALNLFKENKKIVSNIYTNEQMINDIHFTIERLNTKSNFFSFLYRKFNHKQKGALHKESQKDYECR